MDVVFEVITHESARYFEAVRLRESILRVPLGLVFTPEELAAERDHMQISGTLGGRVCACAVLVPEGRVMKMQRVAVAKDVQGRGIGGAMMGFCERIAAEQGVETIYVHARDTAVRFYEQNGYDAQGDYFDEDGIPHLRMQKHIL